MKKPIFTLIELLVVIVIISILMGILLPVLGTVKNKGRILKAQTDMKSITTAVKSYEADYGVLPIVDPNPSDAFGGGLAPSDEALKKYRIFIELLTCLDGPDSSTASPYAVQAAATTICANARSIKYLDVPATYSTTTSATVSQNDFVDPWGGLYKVYLDNDYDGQVTDVGSAGNNLNGSIFIYSFGANKTDDQASSTSPKDDVPSWK